MEILTSKACWVCQVVQPVENFHFDSGARDSRSSRCASCAATSCKATVRARKESTWRDRRKWRLKNPELQSAIARRGYLTKVGADMRGVELSDLIPPLGCACEICGTTKARAKNHNAWNRDHCHASGRLRGWLCLGCNSVLERLHPESPLYPAAQEYLLRHAA